MHYQTRLLPIDADAGFLLAVCHGEHKFGGEDTREIAHAQFLIGNAAQPGNLSDVSALGLPPRPASAAAAAYQRRMAQGQGELANSGNYAAAMAQQYRANELAALHAAQLAEVDGVRVPRLVHASRAGRVLFGYEPTMRVISGEELPGLSRLVDLRDGAVVRDWASNRIPAAGPGKGLERFSSVMMGRPLALSHDGTRVLLFQQGSQALCVAECGDDAKLTQQAQAPLRATRVIAVDDAWLLADDQHLHWLAPGLRALASVAIPGAAMAWNMCADAAGARVAMSSTVGGDVWLLARDGSKPKRYSPHRGAPREARMSLALSDCGSWLASRCEDQLAITRLHDGVSWPLGELRDRVHLAPSANGHVVRSSVPAAFAFIGGRLLAVEDGSVRAIEFAAEGAKAFVSEQGRAGARKPIRVKAGMELPALLRAARLERQIEALQPLHSPALAIKTKALGKAGWLLPEQPRAAALGSSRFGGWPDLPAGVEWPSWQQRPMAFLAQIDLGEAHAAEPGLRLPASGLLSFFLGCSAETYDKKPSDKRPRYLVDLMAGTDANDAGAWRVLFHANPAALGRRVHPGSPWPELFQPCALRFVRGGQVLPDEDTAAYPLLTRAMSEAERDDYNEMVGQLQPQGESSDDQLLGYPRLIQSTPPELMCELSARGADPWTIPETGSAEFTELATAASGWALLLQLTSNADADFCWGDGGNFYFYGDREAMARGDFSKIWVNFEN